MVHPDPSGSEHLWRCFRCQGPLQRDLAELRCTRCGKIYPVISGIPVLVNEPAGYLRFELDAVTRACRDARQRKDLIARITNDVDLPGASIDRHRDVLDAEIARAETFLSLLKPAAAALKTLLESAPPTLAALDVRRSGWAFDTLLPYILCDWAYTDEFEAASSKISAVLSDFFPDPSGKTIAFAGCGAAGLPAECARGFARVLGYDLTLPVLAAARHLLDGKTLELAVPHTVNPAGRISLKRRGPPSAHAPVELLAMDACDTAFVEGTADCVITSFLLDLIPDPRLLADEIHRILQAGGVWINYGPSGTPDSLWRFDRNESAAFFEAAGFTVVYTDAERATYLDLSRDDPSSSFQNHMCYLTAARKTAQMPRKPKAATPGPAELPDVVPRHFPGANLVQQLNLGSEQTRTVLLRHERIWGRVESLEIGGDSARIMALIDGKRTVRDIAKLLADRTPAHSMEETIRAFGRFFEQRLIDWRD